MSVAHTYPCEDECSSRMAAAHMVGEGQATLHGHCLYCNQAVVGGGDLHEYCKNDYAWELKMKAMNKRWQPS